MAIQAPTRITIEVHKPGGDPDGSPLVRVVPDAGTATPTASQPLLAAEPRVGAPAPAAFDPGPCRCLDDDDCNADHAND
jgi:hypothetical protein